MVDPAHWRVVPSDRSEYRLMLKDPDRWYAATVRSDGCVDLTRYFPYEDPEEIHICDVEDLIVRLRSLQALARVAFGPEWPR